MKAPLNLFVLLVFLAGPVALLFDSKPTKSLYSSLFKGGYPLLTGEDSSEEDEESSTLSPSLDLLLNGDPSELPGERQWRAVFEREPESPLHFARYLQEIRTIPADYHETVDRLAPENGWFDLWEASKIAPYCVRTLIDDEAVDQEEEEKALPRYEILDEESFQRCLSLLSQAAQKSEFNVYFNELTTLFLAEASPPETLIDQINYLSGLFGIPSPLSEIGDIEHLIGAAFHRLRLEEDREGFLRLERDLKDLSTKFFNQCNSLVAATYLHGWLQMTNKQMAATAQSLGLTELASRYQELNKKIESRRERLIARDEESTTKDNQQNLLERHGSLLLSISFPIYNRLQPVPVTREDLQPSIRAEKAVMSLSCTSKAFLVFAILAFATWIRKICASEALKVELKDAKPWAIVRVMLTATSAFVLAVLIRYLTPLGQLDRSLLSMGERPALYLYLPFVTMSLFAGSVIVVTTRSVAEPKTRLRLQECLLMILPLMAYLLDGLSYDSEEKGGPFLFALILSILSSGWLGFLLVRALFKAKPSTLTRTSAAVPAYFLIAGFFGIWTWALTIEERYWFSIDDLETPSGHHFTKHEARIFEQYRDELEEFLP